MAVKFNYVGFNTASGIRLCNSRDDRRRDERGEVSIPQAVFACATSQGWHQDRDA